MNAEEQPLEKPKVITDEEFDALCVAIAKLAPRHRRVLVLSIFYDYSTRQIADTLNTPLSSVHYDLARALEAVHAARVTFEVNQGSLFTSLPKRQARHLNEREKRRPAG